MGRSSIDPDWSDQGLLARFQPFSNRQPDYTSLLRLISSEAFRSLCVQRLKPSSPVMRTAHRPTARSWERHKVSSPTWSRSVPMVASPDRSISLLSHWSNREVCMDRRLFLTGLIGLAGAATLLKVAQPQNALAGVPSVGTGILDELDRPTDDIVEPDPARPNAEPVRWRHWEHRHGWRHRRGWRRVCRTYWRHGRRYRRCFRRW
jgi:hypothetical protein